VNGHQTGANEVTLGGFNITPITATAGVLLNMKFTVKPGATGKDSLKIRNFADDLAAATTNDGVFEIISGMVIAIAQAHAKTNCETVTVEGIVTRALGRFARLQDDTGGLTAFETSGAFRTAIDSGRVRQGDRLRISGVLSEFNALEEITPVQAFAVISRNNALAAAQKVNLAELKNNGEAYESKLIRVDSLLINRAGDFGFVVNKTYQITDGSDKTNAVALRTPAGTDTQVGGYPIPNYFNFEGVLGQFSSADPATGYQLQPVLITDIDSLKTAVAEYENGVPAAFALQGNYPNPFNPSTVIRYDLPRPVFVRLAIYDVLGKKIRTLAEGMETAGYKQAQWNGKDEAGMRVASGVYLYRLTAADFAATRALLLMK